MAWSSPATTIVSMCIALLAPARPRRLKKSSEVWEREHLSGLHESLIRLMALDTGSGANQMAAGADSGCTPPPREEEQKKREQKAEQT